MTSPEFPLTYYHHQEGCTTHRLELAQGFRLAMTLEMETQCCSAYPSLRDDVITVTDGNGDIIFNQTEQFSLTSDGQVLFNSLTKTATVKFCKFTSVVEEKGYSLSYHSALEPLAFNDYDKVSVSSSSLSP